MTYTDLCPHPSAVTPPGMLRVVVAYLEMAAPPAGPVPAPACAPPLPGLVLERLVRPDLRLYRRLYDGVGESWLWHERRELGDAKLAALLEDDRLELLVPRLEGQPLGYAELDRRRQPTVNLAYFGLFPDHIGKGLGPWLLRRAIAAAWEGGTSLLKVNTCTFDHPAALGLYHRHGFRMVRAVERLIRDPRRTGVLPPGAAPHIPLALP
jgi:GNAT superfamily N-acetyltransferase